MSERPRDRTTHLCHWPGCREVVSPRYFACRPHWASLPWLIKLRILRSYRPGQEIDKNPSPDYIAAAKAAREWVLRGQPTITAAPTRPYSEPAERDT